MGHNWASSDQGPALPSLMSPAMPRFLYCFLFPAPVSGLGLVLPLPPTMLTPESTTGKGPSSCDTGLFQGGWEELGTTLLPSLVHLSAYPSPCPEPTLPFLAHTNVHAGKAPWQRGQKVASSVPNPSLDTLALPFPPQKYLLFARGELTTQAHVASYPLPWHQDLSLSVCPLAQERTVPAKWVCCWWFFFHTCGRITSRMGKKKVKEAGKKKKKKLMSPGSTGKIRSCKIKWERCKNGTSVYDTSPHTFSFPSCSGDNGSQCARLGPPPSACQTAGKIYWIKPQSMPEMDVCQDNCIFFPCRQRKAMWFARVSAGTTGETLILR